MLKIVEKNTLLVKYQCYMLHIIPREDSKLLLWSLKHPIFLKILYLKLLNIKLMNYSNKLRNRK